jgi:hypothetical protein
MVSRRDVSRRAQLVATNTTRPAQRTNSPSIQHRVATRRPSSGIAFPLACGNDGARSVDQQDPGTRRPLANAMIPSGCQSPRWGRSQWHH